MNARKRYPSDLTDDQWSVIEDLIPKPKPGGRTAQNERRQIVNGLLYVTRTGCQWRALPHDLPPWRAVYWYFMAWRDDGTLERVHDRLRSAVRKAAGRDPQPTAAVLDSQSVKTTEGASGAATSSRTSPGGSVIDERGGHPGGDGPSDAQALMSYLIPGFSHTF